MMNFLVMTDSVKKYKFEAQRAKKARERYGRKRALELGISFEKYLETKKLSKLEKKKQLKKKWKLSQKKLAIAKQQIRIQPTNSQPKIDFEAVSITIIYPSKKDSAKYNHDFETILDKLILLTKQKKLGYYDGNEYGMRGINHFRWYFITPNSKRLGKLMFTLLKKIDYMKKTVITMTKVYTDKTIETNKLTL